MAGAASSYSATVSSITLAAAPTALIAASASGLTVTLAWTNNATSETAFIVQRSDDGGQDWTTLGTAPATLASTASYVDNTAREGTRYTYQVAAVNGAGTSAFTNAATITLAPAAPAGLAASAVSSTQINLSWINISGGDTGILIERSPNGQDWTDLTTATPSTSAYSDSGLIPGTTYQYRISALNWAAHRPTASSPPSPRRTPRPALPPPPHSALKLI